MQSFVLNYHHEMEELKAKLEQAMGVIETQNAIIQEYELNGSTV